MIGNMETYNGAVRTPGDAIILFEACRQGILPRVQRRLSEKERQTIRSGSVFVWDEREAGMRRWTDGKSWSASRVSGSFLTYREMEGKRGGNGLNAPLARAGRTPDSGKGSDTEDRGADEPDGYRYKADGLMKQSFSITTSSGNHLHLISYYSRAQGAMNNNMVTPSNDPTLRHVRAAKGIYPESTIQDAQNTPAMIKAPLGQGPYMPQHMGYGRPPPHHLTYSQVPPEIGHWQGQQMQGPPMQHYPSQHYGYPQPPPRPQANMMQYAQPLPQGHSQALLPPIQQPQYAPMPPQGQSPMGASTPPTNGLPRPVPSAHHRSTSSGSNFASFTSNPSPRVGEAVVDVQAQAPYQPSPQHTTPNGKPDSTPIDPQLLSFPQDRPHFSPPIKADPTTPPQNRVQPYLATSTSMNPLQVTAASAATIPSITALINAHSTADAQEVQRSRSQSKSPSGTKHSKIDTHDIPSEKLAFKEDVRTLRILDQGFKA